MLFCDGGVLSIKARVACLYIKSIDIGPCPELEAFGQRKQRVKGPPDIVLPLQGVHNSAIAPPIAFEDSIRNFFMKKYSCVTT